MQIRFLVSAIIAPAALIWAGMYWLSGGQPSWDLFKPYGAVVTIVTVLAVGFERFLWRLPFIMGFLVKRPSVIGTWETRLESSWRPPGGGPPTVKTVYLVISQTLTTLSVRMYTDKAHSRSLAENFRESENDALFELAVVYQNVPDIGERLPDGTGRIHFGAMLIPNVSYQPSSLKGHYWTDRQTQGMLTLMRRDRRLASSYVEAQEMFSQPALSVWSHFKSFF